MLTKVNANLPDDLGIFADGYFAFKVKWEDTDDEEYEEYFNRYDKMVEYIENVFHHHKVSRMKVLLTGMNQLYFAPSLWKGGLK